MANIDSTSYSESPHDTLGFRLTQIKAMVECLSISITATDGSTEVSPTTVAEALWGVTTLIDQAQNSWNAIQEAERASRKNGLGS